jgi:hypothetical protein
VCWIAGAGLTILPVCAEGELPLIQAAALVLGLGFMLRISGPCILFHACNSGDSSLAIIPIIINNTSNGGGGSFPPGLTY